jgi:hypothetical protein
MLYRPLWSAIVMIASNVGQMLRRKCFKYMRREEGWVKPWDTDVQTM